MLVSLFTPGCGVRDTVAVAGWRNVLPSSPGPMARVRGPRVNMSAQSHRTPTLQPSCVTHCRGIIGMVYFMCS